MAAHDTAHDATATGNDYAQHEQTYVGFVRLVKLVVAATVVILLLLAYFLV